MNTCKSCGAPIKFIRTASGAAMPCDPKPVYYLPRPDGKDLVVDASGGRVVCCEILPEPTRDCKAGLIPHWVTCPAAARHRKK